MRAKGTEESHFFYQRQFSVKSATIITNDRVYVTTVNDKSPGCIALHQAQSKL